MVQTKATTIKKKDVEQKLFFLIHKSLSHQNISKIFCQIYPTSTMRRLGLVGIKYSNYGYYSNNIDEKDKGLINIPLFQLEPDLVDSVQILLIEDNVS